MSLRARDYLISLISAALAAVALAASPAALPAGLRLLRSAGRRAIEPEL